jgi:hypothetical protein
MHPAAPPSASATAAHVPSAIGKDPRFIRAKGLDPIDLARLANDVGATELLVAVEDGGEIEATALAAIGFARDADLALLPLANRAATCDAGERRAVLEALVNIAGRPRDQNDPIDPDGGRAAAATLVEIARRASIDREDRALAVSAARALAEKGFIDSAKITADLDPR